MDSMLPLSLLLDAIILLLSARDGCMRSELSRRKLHRKLHHCHSAHRLLLSITTVAALASEKLESILSFNFSVTFHADVSCYCVPLIQTRTPYR